MLLKSMVWLSPRSICCGGGSGWEGGKEKEAVILEMAIVSENNDTSSLVQCGRGYRAGTAWLSESESAEDTYSGRWRGAKASQAVLSSVICSHLCCTREQSSIDHEVSYSLWPTRSPMTTTEVIVLHWADTPQVLLHFISRCTFSPIFNQTKLVIISSHESSLRKINGILHNDCTTTAQTSTYILRKW